MLFRTPSDTDMIASATSALEGGEKERFFDFTPDPVFSGIVSGTVPDFVFNQELSHNLDDDSPLHRLIIGDNAHALVGLSGERFDLVYIDPPYNTGKKFVYSDRFADTWCSFMYPRLKLARTLLKDTGVIMVAIGLAEQHRLRMLMDSIFGTKNLIGQVHWESGRKNDARFLSNSVDYMLIYAKDDKALRKSGAKWRERDSDADAYFDLAAQVWRELEYVEDTDARRETALVEFRKRARRKFPEAPSALLSFSRFDENGNLYSANGDMSFPGGGGYKYDVIHPVTGHVCSPPREGYVCVEPTMERWISEGLIEFGKDHTTQIKKRRFTYEGQSLSSVVVRSRRASHNHVGAILGNNVFHYPKDHIELARWFNLAASKDAKILDFFGGSGSTAEAVLLLNQQDGGTREVTLATNNDNNIGTDITRERVVRVMTGEGWADGKPHDGYGGKLAVWFVS